MEGVGVAIGPWVTCCTEVGLWWTGGKLKVSGPQSRLGKGVEGFQQWKARGLAHGKDGQSPRGQDRDLRLPGTAGHTGCEHRWCFRQLGRKGKDKHRWRSVDLMCDLDSTGQFWAVVPSVSSQGQAVEESLCWAQGRCLQGKDGRPSNDGIKSKGREGAVQRGRILSLVTEWITPYERGGGSAKPPSPSPAPHDWWNHHRKPGLTTWICRFVLFNEKCEKLETHIEKSWISCHPVALYVVSQSCSTLCDPMDCSPPSSSVHGILQARILEWVVMPSFRGSSQPKDQTQVSRLTSGFFLLSEPPGKPKNTGVGNLSFLQEIFTTQELNQGLLHCRQILCQLSLQREAP